MSGSRVHLFLEVEESGRTEASAQQSQRAAGEGAALADLGRMLGQVVRERDPRPMLTLAQAIVRARAPGRALDDHITAAEDDLLAAAQRVVGAWSVARAALAVEGDTQKGAA